MKKLALTFAIMAIVAVNPASAEMVDIGTGRMEQSDFSVLKAMVQGRQSDCAPALSTLRDRPERYGMVEMTREAFQSLHDKVAGRSTSVDAGPVVQAVRMINIGTGEMPVDEFIALKNRVAKTEIFRLDHLAKAQP